MIMIVMYGKENLLFILILRKVSVILVLKAKDIKKCDDYLSI